jgi:hypothetical protein
LDQIIFGTETQTAALLSANLFMMEFGILSSPAPTGEGCA